MLPLHAPWGSKTLPVGATFWNPTTSDIDEEGIGFFRDTWLISKIRHCEALAAVSAEARHIEVLSTHARNFEEFDELASLVEALDSDSDIVFSSLPPAGSEVYSYMTHEAELGLLENLELGVAGLTFSLVSVGLTTAASCRSHPGVRAWSEAPVVLFAADRRRAEALVPLVGASDCLFGTDSGRPELITLTGPSVQSLNELAALVLENRETFSASRRPKGSGPAPATVRVKPDTLF